MDPAEPTKLLRLEQVPLHQHDLDGTKVEAWEVRTPEGERAYVIAFEETEKDAFEGAGRMDQLGRLAADMGRILGGARGILTVVPPGCKLRIYEVKEAPVISLPGRDEP